MFPVSMAHMEYALTQINLLMLRQTLAHYHFHYIYRPSQEDYIHFLINNHSALKLALFGEFKNIDFHVDNLAFQIGKYVSIKTPPPPRDLTFHFDGTRLDFRFLDEQTRSVLALFSQFDWDIGGYDETKPFSLKLNTSLENFPHLASVKICKPGIDRSLEELKKVKTEISTSVVKYEIPTDNSALGRMTAYLYTFFSPDLSDKQDQSGEVVTTKRDEHCIFQFKNMRVPRPHPQPYFSYL